MQRLKAPKTATELAALIRAGCRIAPKQVFYSYIVPDDEAACAMGAAYLAAGGRGGYRGAMIWARRVRKALPVLLRCPACGGDHQLNNGTAIEHLNDTHRWTREQIADWLESVETAGG